MIRALALALIPGIAFADEARLDALFDSRLETVRLVQCGGLFDVLESDDADTQDRLDSVAARFLAMGTSLGEGWRAEAMADRWRMAPDTARGRADLALLMQYCLLHVPEGGAVRGR